MPPQESPAADVAWRAATASPLLHELVRALRARRHHGQGAPALRAILARASSVWRAALKRSPALGLRVDPDGFVLSSGESIGGAPIVMLARELGRAGIAQLQFKPALRSEEIQLFVEIVVAALDSGVSPSDYERAFKQADIRNIALGCAPPAAAPEKPEPPIERRESLPVRKPRADRDPLAVGLTELERSREVVGFQRAMEKLRAVLDPRIEAGDYVDAYAVALTLGRHSADRRSSAVLRQVASESLQALVLGDRELVRVSLERVYGRPWEAAIEALQLLSALGPRIVPSLLDAHEWGSAAARAHTASVLLAMGDAAFPALLEQLGGSDLSRALLTAELLGQMQNPRALSALSAALSVRRPPQLRLAAASAVAALGGERARVVLESHSRAEDAVGELCRAALRDWHRRRGG